MDPAIFRRSYDRFAPRYDAIFTAQQAPKIRALFAALPRPLPAPAVDLGCGTGLVARLTGLDPIGLDVSRGMLQRCPGRRVQGDMARLPFADAAFGLAFAVTSLLDFGPDPPAVAEMARVLRPDGLLAISALKRDDLPALEAALARARLQVIRRLDLVQDAGYICRRAP